MQQATVIIKGRNTTTIMAMIAVTKVVEEADNMIGCWDDIAKCLWWAQI